MTLSYAENVKLEAEIQALKSDSTPFAMATIVRTVNATSAKPGGKALLDQDGNILVGWIGGGCARGAVKKATCKAILTGTPQFISLLPPELLEEEGLKAGQIKDGVEYAKNGCPSKGTMDIFIEPVLPKPRLVIFGTSLVAVSLALLAKQFDFDITTVNPEGVGKFNLEENAGDNCYLVVASQGQGDLNCLNAALSARSKYISFVGSAKKFSNLAERIAGERPELRPQLETIKAPAGIDINAITPEEIALSIMAQIIEFRRSNALSQEQSDA